MHRQTTKQAAKGKWDGIIAQLLGEQAVSKRHGPCPICGGKDRYRYDNKRNDGDWYCNVCGTGDGFKLLEGALQIDFAEAARQVDYIVNNCEAKPFKDDIDLEKRKESLNKIWAEASDWSVVVDYLSSRKIPKEILQKTTDLRGHSGLQMRTTTGTKELDRWETHPAMLALIRNAKGQPISIHRTYLGKNIGKAKKIMPPLETITGGYIKLGEPDDVLCLAEGIETALAAWAITKQPAWAMISAGNLEKFTAIPKHVKTVYVFADNDLSFVGQGAAFKCAATLQNRIGVKTKVWMPKEAGYDEADLLRWGLPGSYNHLVWRGKP